MFLFQRLNFELQQLRRLVWNYTAPVQRTLLIVSTGSTESMNTMKYKFRLNMLFDQRALHFVPFKIKYKANIEERVELTSVSISCVFIRCLFVLLFHR